MIRLNVKVDNISLVLEVYDKIKIYRASSEAGVYLEITDATTRLTLIPENTTYWYDDSTGSSSSWYKTSYFNSTTLAESARSDALQGCTELTKIGYTFDNYSVPPDEWGEILTPDDLRFTYLWGIDLTAQDVQASDVSDAQLKWCIKESLAAFERDFNLNIRKRVYKVEPSSSLNQGVEWRTGVDYTDEEDWYDFSAVRWQNFGFMQLRHWPILSVETAALYDVLGNQILDILSWLRIYKKAGQIAIYPKGNFSLGRGFIGSSAFAAWPMLFGSNYPNAFKIEYTTGFKNSDFVPNDLRGVVGMYAAVAALGWIGDGLLAGFSSSSISLDGLSESFSSTQSATSAYFGARIKSYLDQLKQFKKTNKYKHTNIPIGFIG